MLTPSLGRPEVNDTSIWALNPGWGLDSEPFHISIPSYFYVITDKERTWVLPETEVRQLIIL